MKFNILSLLIFISVPFNYAQNSKSFTYHKNGNEYRLTVKSWQTSTNYGHGLNIAFSVYKNGKFVHPADVADGRYIGCRYPFNGAGKHILNRTIKRLWREKNWLGDQWNAKLLWSK